MTKKHTYKYRLYANKSLFESLRSSNARFRTIFEKAAVGISIIDRTGGVIIEANPALQEMLGYDNNDFQQMGIAEITHPDDLKPTLELYRQITTGEQESVQLNKRYLHKDGHIIWTRLTVSAVRDRKGELQFIIGMVLNVTERRQAQEALAKSEERFRLFAENAQDILYRLSLHPKIQFEYVSPAAPRITGYTAEEFANDGLLLFKLVNLEDSNLLAKIMAGKINFNKPFRTRITTKGQSIIWLEHRAVPVCNAEGQLIAVEGIARDITAQKQLEEKLAYLSQHDTLTGLYNRVFFEAEMRRLQEDNINPAGIIVCDVDGLKLINDTLGHSTGDKYLSAVARVIEKAVRNRGVVTRIGGDELAILLPGSDKAAANEIFQELRAAIREYNTASPQFMLSISMGFAARTKLTLSMTDLFREADNSMYREKLSRKQDRHSVIINTLMKSLQVYDYIAEGHTQRVKKIIIAMAVELGMPEHILRDLRLLAQFHDIGKVGVPERLLFKQEPLSDNESCEVQKHCELGYRIALTAPLLNPIADWVLKHHEWWNGVGYPLGIAGDEIPVECRMLAIADAFDVMTSNRPCRPALTVKAAINELKQKRGTKFDPELVDLFLKIFYRGGGDINLL